MLFRSGLINGICNATAEVLREDAGDLAGYGFTPATGDVWFKQTESMKKDLEYVQKVKGTKVLVCEIMHNIGDGYTPDGVSFEEYWGWEGDLNLPQSQRATAVPTPNQEEVIRRYARMLAEDIISRGYDGYDIDYELGYGPTGTIDRKSVV